MTPSNPGGENKSTGSTPLDSTASLLKRARDGETSARESLFARFLPILHRWAHGRLPRYARDLSETDDLVQATLMRSLSKLESFEPRREGAFLAYLRKILVNQVLDEIRRVQRRPRKESLQHDVQGRTRSPYENLISAETWQAYETALSKLRPRTREAVILHLEFGYTNPQIAAAIDASSANAVRMLVARALVTVAEEMNRVGMGPEPS